MSNVENIKNTALRKIAEECQHRSTGDFGMTIVGGVDLEKFAMRVIEEYEKELKESRREVKSTLGYSRVGLGNI